MSAIAETYESWKQCLSRNLGSEMNLSFIEKRVASFSNKNDAETKKFIQAYGAARTEQVLTWFKALEQEMRA